ANGGVHADAHDLDTAMRGLADDAANLCSADVQSNDKIIGQGESPPFQVRPQTGPGFFALTTSGQLIFFV
ncbi:MAG: hypothetical protein SV487_13395, partial [Thermodesulfobacteriota bacterium]|nr:hypothetical protein [Thermodesulfobacteriota bacterium]